MAGGYDRIRPHCGPGGRPGADHGEPRWHAAVVAGEGRPVATCDVLAVAAETWLPSSIAS
jgi:hypothetical protein